MKVTPKMASTWMSEKNYEDNRPISKTRVSYYARQMKQGRWKLNMEPIIFDLEDHLLNGQHRLMAIIESKKTIELLIAKGVKTDCFTTMDQGYSRTGGQILTMKGFSNASSRAAVCRALYMWEVSGGTITKTGKVSADEILLVQDVYPDEVDAAVNYLAKSIVKDLPLRSGMTGLAHLLCHRARPKKAKEFFEILSDGVTSVRGHPALILRNRIMKDAIKGLKYPAGAEFAMMVRAWNSYEAGKTIRSLAVKKAPDGTWKVDNIRGLGNKKIAGKVK
jgi:hypothetical protein